jgi:hypothetical protein
MAGVKISALPALASALGTDLYPTVQGGTTYKGTLSQIQTFLGFSGGILAIAQGGTAVASVTTAPTASSWAGWDANSNLSANNFLAGYATTATAAATTTLTVASAYQQYFTGVTTQNVIMPVTSTLVLGQSWFIVNNSSGVVTVKSSGGNTIQAMAANTTLLVTCILTSGTTAASWNAEYVIESAITLPLSLANGGTNNSLTANNGGIVWSDASKLNILSGTATANQMLVSGSTATPAWSTNTVPVTDVKGDIWYASATNVISGLAIGGTGTIMTVAAGLPAWTTATYPSTTTINQLLYSSSANVVAGLATANNGVLFTSAGGVPSIGTAPIVAGGTGVTSVTTSPTASAWAGWDANKNLSANNLLEGYTTVATAAATTTLTVASTYLQFFTGSTTQTVLMPVANTLVLGQQFSIYNNSSGVVTVQSSGGNTIQAMAANTTLLLTCILTSGTTAASWNAEYVIASALTLPLALASGGTNAALTASNGGIFYSTASAGAILSGTATAGLALLSGASTTPTWSTSPPITQVNVQSITATGAFTYTPTSGTKYAIFELQGAGGGSGGGGGAGGQGSAPSGGGGGGYQKILVSGSANLAAISGSVGAGGTAGAAAAGNAGAGGNTTLTINSGTQWVAGGGGAGQGSASSAGSSFSYGVTGGTNTTGTNGTLEFARVGGTSGICNINAAVSTVGSMSSYGGASQLGGSSQATFLVSVAGLAYGGGAAAAANCTTGNLAGQAGAQGIVIVTEFISV